MRIFRASSFAGKKAWDAIEIATIDGVATRLYWTNGPHRWHTNRGGEIFAVLDGRVEMFYEEGGGEASVVLGPGDIFHAAAGTYNKAYPLDEARILIVQRAHGL